MKQIEIKQYLRPNGRIKIVFGSVENDIAELAKDMIISTEVRRDGGICIYARYSDDEEENERMVFARNDGIDPNIKLAEVIGLVAEGRITP